MMGTLGSDTPNAKHRRRHTPQFREEVLKACEEPGRSVAAVARCYQLNANLIHKWRRDRAHRKGPALPAFVPLNALVVPQILADEATVKVALPGKTGPVVLHWPLTHIDHLAHWLRQL